MPATTGGGGGGGSGIGIGCILDMKLIPIGMIDMSAAPPFSMSAGGISGGGVAL